MSTRVDIYFILFVYWKRVNFVGFLCSERCVWRIFLAKLQIMKWNPWLLNLIVFTPNGIVWEPIKHIPWVVPPPSNSHHQDYYIFSRDPYKPSFATITGRGDNPTYPPTFLYSWNMTAEIWYLTLNSDLIQWPDEWLEDPFVGTRLIRVHMSPHDYMMHANIDMFCFLRVYIRV